MPSGACGKETREGYMNCKTVKLKDGQVVLVSMSPGSKLSERDMKTLEEYAEYCRAHAAKTQRERNQRTK